jgi:hypothetical protein
MPAKPVLPRATADRRVISPARVGDAADPGVDAPHEGHGDIHAEGKIVSVSEPATKIIPKRCHGASDEGTAPSSLSHNRWRCPMPKPNGLIPFRSSHPTGLFRPQQSTPG